MSPKIEFKVGHRILSPALKGLNPGVIIAVNDAKITMQWLGPDSALKGDKSITYSYAELRGTFEDHGWHFIIDANKIWKELNE